MIPIFYRQEQNVEAKVSVSPSPNKPKLLLEHLIKHKAPIRVESDFKPLTQEQLSVCHDDDYVRDVLNLKRENGFGNINAEVSASLPYVAGSMLAAADWSYFKMLPSVSFSSSAHHAHFARGGSFCSFNFLIMAAIKVHELGAKRVGLLDFDEHFSDGCVSLKEKLNLDWLQIYSYGGNPPSTKAKAKVWLRKLPTILKQFEKFDFIIINASVDPHENSFFGGALTATELKKRDRIVFQALHNYGIPFCISLGGGYTLGANDDLTPTLKLHENTLKELWAIYKEDLYEPSPVDFVEHLLKQGFFEDVIEICRANLAGNYKKNVQLLRLLGCASGAIGDHTSAKSAFLDAFAVSKSDLDLANLITTFWSLGKIPQAIEAVETYFLIVSAEAQEIILQSAIEAIRAGYVTINKLPQVIQVKLNNVKPILWS